MSRPSGFPRATPLRACLLVAALVGVVPTALAQVSVEPRPPTLAPTSAALESPSVGATVSAGFAIESEAGLEAIFLCLDTCSDGRDFTNGSGTLSDGQSTWELDMGTCSGGSNDCDVTVAFTAGDDTARAAQLLVFDQGARIAAASITGTLAPQPMPGRAVFLDEDTTVAEGARVTLRVGRTGGTDGALVARVDLFDGTADENDYRLVSPASGSLRWEPGESRSFDIVLEASADTDPDPDETFFVLLDLDDGAPVEITITDVPPEPDPEPGEATLAISTDSVTEGDTLPIVIGRSGGSDGRLTAFFAVENIDAIEGTDYTVSPSGPLVWENTDVTTRTVTITALTDALVEGPESFEFLLARRGDDLDQSADITVIDATPVPVRGTVEFASESGRVTEGSRIEVPVRRVGGTDGAFVAFFGIDAGGGAGRASDADFRIVSPANGALAWDDGEGGVRTITVEALADTVNEGDETFRLRLASDGNGEEFDQSSAVTISDAFARGEASFASAAGSLAEGTRLAFAVERIDGADGTLEARIDVENGTASAADYRIVSPANGLLSWPNGDAAPREVIIEALADDLVERAETFTLALGPVRREAARGTFRMRVPSAEITILDATEPPRPGRATFASASGALDEGTELDVVVNRVDGADGPLEVVFALDDGSAGDADYRLVAPTGDTLRWADADTSPRTITVEALADALTEPNETFSVVLADDVEALFDRASEITIRDVPPEPDPEPGVVSLAEAAYTVPEDAGSVVLTVLRVGGSDGAAAVSYRVAAGTATTPADFGGAASGRVTWADGDAASKSIVVPIVDDAAVETDETFTVTLSRPTAETDAANGVTLGEPLAATVTITDDDVPGTLAFDPLRYAVTEADGRVTLSVSRTGGSAGPATVRWRARDGSAVAGQDYGGGANAAPGGTLSWAAGESDARDIVIAVASDARIEGEEDFTVVLSAPTGATLGEGSTGTVLIGDSTPIPLDRVAFAAAEREVDESVGTARLPVRRIGDGTGAVTVRYRLELDGASRDDLGANAALAGTLSWAAGDTGERTIEIPIVDDARLEDSERVLAVLESAVGAEIGSPASSALVILDDERAGTLAFDPVRYTVSEADGTLTLSVRRRNGAAGPARVRWATRDGRARAGDDFAPGESARSGTLDWAAGDAGERTITLDIVADAAREPDEDFAVVLSAPSGAALGEARTATVTIEDGTVVTLDRLAFAETTFRADESDGNARLVVRRAGAGDGAASVRYAIELADDGAAAGSATRGDLGRGVALEGVLSWAAGDTGERTIGLSLVNDALVEGDERFTVRLVRPSGATLGDSATSTVIIVDDDAAPAAVTGFPRFVAAEPRVEERAGEIVVAVERVGGTDGALSVEVRTVDDGAVAGRDYTGVDGVLRWESGEGGVRTVTVPVLADAEREPDERFLVRLGEATANGEPLAFETGEIAVTVVDTTSVGTLVLSDARVEAFESAGEVRIAISRTGGSDGPMSVRFETLTDPEGTITTRARDFVPASPFDDFGDAGGTLSWANGEDGVREARIPIVDDALDEPDETFRVRFVDVQPTGVEISGGGEVGVTIVDDDEPFIPGDPNVAPLATLGELRLVVASGSGQSGLPGDILEPMIADVLDAADGDRATPNVPVRWVVNPAGSALLLEGERTVSDGDGSVRNRVRVRSRGFLNVIAVIDVAGADTAPADGTGPGQAAFLVRAGIAAQRALSDNQLAAGTALDTLCETLGARIENGEELPPASLDLFATCTELDARVADDDARLGASLDRLAPEELFAIGDSIIDTTDIQVTNVYARINALRSSTRGGVDLSGLDLDVYGERIPGAVVDAARQAWSGGDRAAADAGPRLGLAGLGGGGASADGPGSRLGVFVNGLVSSGEVDGAGNQRDADVSTAGVTVGADYRFSANTVAGVGLGLVVNETAFGSNDGSVDLDGLALTLFATRYAAESGYVDGVLEIGRNTYDVRRRINLPGLPDQFGLGETEADVLSVTIGAGKDIRAGRYEFGPYFRLSHTSASVAGYTERASADGPGAGSVLDVRAHDVRSTRLALGGQLSRTVDTRRGVLVPQLRLETEFENEERKDGIAASFQHDPDGVPFTVNGSPRDTGGYINIGIGGSAVFANGRSGYLFYETRAAHEYVTQHWLKAGFRLEF